MTHESSFFYLKLFSNIIMGCGLGIAFPYALINTARTVRYMQGPNSKTLVHVATWWLGLLGVVFLFDIINMHLGPDSMQVYDVYVRVTAAVFTITLAICCYNQRHAFRSLYPKEDFVFEQEKRRKLLEKMLACDAAMPLARFETKAGVVTAANTFAQDLLGYNLLELHKLVPGALVHPDDRARVLQNVLVHDGLPYECRVLTATGRTIQVEVRSIAAPDDASVRIVFLTDVTRYVEERDRRLRDFRSQQSLKLRQKSEELFLAQLHGQEVPIHQ